MPFFIEFSCTFYDKRYSCLLNWIEYMQQSSEVKIYKVIKDRYDFNMRQVGIMKMLSKCFFARVRYLRFIKMVSI